MQRVTSSTEVAAPPHVIWRVLCDPRRYPEFADPADKILSMDKAVFGEGYHYREYGGVPPFKSESDWEVTEFEPVRHQHHVGNDSKMRFDLDIALEPVDAGHTKVSMDLEVSPKGFMSVIAPVMWPLMMRSRAQASIDRTVENLKSAV